MPGPSEHVAASPTAIGSDVLCHRLAVTTALVSLLPITLGVLTTTYDAGMAFPDWPTSAGENMFLYDVIADVFAGARDKVLEHGHRLAGALIGLTTLITAGVFSYRRGRRAETYVVWAAVAAVILQGLLGGFRVRLDERAVAMAHGLGGAFVFTALISLATITSRAWVRVASEGSARPAKSAVVWGYVLVAAVVAQYTLGGFVRHLGWGLWTHMGSASAVFVAAIVVGVIAMRTRVPTLRRVGWMLHAVVTVQIALGFAAWWTKYAPTEGAVVDLTAPATVWSRSLHAITGMALLATSVAYVLFVTRLKSSSGRPVGAVAGSSS
ncbi:MAG: COX15/CtaA family protein [Planctomycetota bacterium]